MYTPEKRLAVRYREPHQIRKLVIKKKYTYRSRDYKSREKSGV